MLYAQTTTRNHSRARTNAEREEDSYWPQESQNEEVGCLHPVTTPTEGRASVLTTSPTRLSQMDSDRSEDILP